MGSPWHLSFLLSPQMDVPLSDLQPMAVSLNWSDATWRATRVNSRLRIRTFLESLEQLMIMRCIQKDSQLEDNASKSDARVNQVFTRQKESDATKEKGCHFYIPLELDLSRNLMLKELVDIHIYEEKISKIFQKIN